jgi:hypothetical protein
MPRTPATLSLILLVLVVSLSSAMLFFGDPRRAAAVAPPNDNSASAEIASPLPFADQQDTDDATDEAGEIKPCGSIGKTVWYTYTPGADGVLEANTAGSDFNTVLAVQAYAFASPPLGLGPIACAAPSDSNVASVEIPVTAGTQYFFQVGGDGAAFGTAIFNLSYHPANDDFEDAQLIGTIPFATSIPTVDATLEAGESTPGCEPAIGKTLWFRYAPVGNYSITVHTAGSDFNTVVAMYTVGPTSLVEVGCSDDDETSEFDETLTVALEAGVEYFIQIGGEGGASGQLALSVTGPLKGSISGTVLDEDGQPFGGVDIIVESDVCCGVESTVSAADGSYMVDGLLPGNYRVSASAEGYVSEYYLDKQDFFEADLVAVTAGMNTPNINFQLALGGIIFGTVEDEFGNPIEGAFVFADAEPCCYSAFAITDDEGLYAITGLATGAYRVQASATGFADEYWNNTYDFDLATPVDVTAGDFVLDIDFALAAGATISGTVVDQDDNPIADADLFAGADCSETPSSLLDCNILAFATTAADGTYTIEDLPPGDYFLQVNADGFDTEFYDNVTTLAQATPVTLTVGATRNDVDFKLGLEPEPTQTSTPTPSPTGETSTPTPVPTETESPHTPSATSTAPGGPTAPPDTATPTPADATPTSTIVPASPTDEPDATATNTPIPAATETETAGATATTEPPPDTPTSEATATEQPDTATATATAAPTNTVAPQPTSTETTQPSATATATTQPSPTASSTPVTQPTATATAGTPTTTRTTSTQSATRTPTRTATAPASPTTAISSSATRVSTVLASTAVASPTRAGVSAPDTGAGRSRAGNGDRAAAIAGIAGGVLLAGGLALGLRRRAT